MEGKGVVTSMEQTNQSGSPQTEEEHLAHSSRSSSCAGETAATKTEEARKKKKADRHPPSCCQKVPRATLLGKRIRVPLVCATTTTTAATEREEGGSVPCGGQAAEESESEEEVDYNSPKAANTFLSILKRTKERVIGESPPSSSPSGVGTAATLLSPPSHNIPPPQPQRGEAELRERIRARRQRTDSLESSLFVPKWDSLLSHFATNSSLHQREAMQSPEGEAAANSNNKNRCGEQRAQPHEEEDTTSLRRQRLLSKWWQVERGTAHKPTPQGQRSSVVAACLPTSSILAGTVNSVGNSNKVNTDAEAQQQRLLDLKEEDVFVMSEEEEATNNNVPETSITASNETEEEEEEEEDNDNDDDGEEEDEEAAGTERMMLAPSEFYAARPYLFGMAVPVCNEHIRTLKALGVGLLVSATADPLKGGLMVNRQPRLSVRDVVEYTDIDHDIFKRGCGPRKIRRIHIPIVDGSPPSTQNMLNFLAEAKATIDAGKAVAVHCWQGKGRTGTLIAGYLIYYEKMEPQTAIDYIRSLSPGSLCSPDQVEYLLSECFPERKEDDDKCEDEDDDKGAEDDTNEEEADKKNEKENGEEAEVDQRSRLDALCEIEESAFDRFCSRAFFLHQNSPPGTVCLWGNRF